MGWSVERTSFDVMGKEERLCAIEDMESFAFFDRWLLIVYAS